MARKALVMMSVVLVILAIVATMILVPKPGINAYGFYQTKDDVKVIIQPCVVTDDVDSESTCYHLDCAVVLKSTDMYIPVKARDMERSDFREVIAEQKYVGVDEDAFRTSNDANVVFETMTKILHPESRNFDGIVWVPAESVSVVG